MSETFDVLIKGGTVVNHDGSGERDIGIRDGRIAAIGRLTGAGAAEVIDAANLHVLPGVIDTQVHFREPGLEQKEDLETGSRAAVAGGVTAVFEMPNTKPLTISAETLADKVKRARHRMFCDFAFYVGGTRETVDDIPALERLESSAGIKVFMGASTGDLLVEDEPSLERIIAKISRRAAFHSEDEARLRERAGLRRKGDASSHPVWRDETAAMIATERLVRLAEKHRKRIHVLHVSTGQEIAFLAEHKDWASVEVTPHHLTLVAPDCYDRLGTFAQMNPPVRDDTHRQAIWAGIASGVVDVLGSDHAPHTREEKDHPYPESHSGMTGVQTLVPIMLDHVNAGPPVAAALRRPHQPRARSACSAYAARAASPSATTPTSPSSTSAAPKPSRMTGFNRAAAGRPTTARKSRAGPSAPSCAAAASCGTAPSSAPPPASR